MAQKAGSTGKVVFVDRISAFSLARILFYGNSLVCYFDPIDPFWRRSVAGLKRVRLLRAEVRPIDYHIGQVKDDRGANAFEELLRDTVAIRSKITRDQLRDNPLIQKLAPVWAPEKVELYFEKAMEPEIRNECYRIALVKWILAGQSPVAARDCVIIVERRHWFPYLQAHAATKGVRLVAYRRLLNLKKARMVVGQFFQLLKRAIGRLQRPGPSAPSPAIQRPAGAKPGSATIAMRYGYRKLSFDPNERSEFSWLSQSDIPGSELLVYDYVADKPLDAETLNQLKTRGVRLFGRGPGISAWMPSRRFPGLVVRMALKVILAWLGTAVRGQRVALYYVRGSLALALNYAYWYDFFAANRVRVNIGVLNTSVGQTLALDALNALSVSYQFSIAIVLSFPTVISGGEDIQFVFSPLFEPLWRSLSAPPVAMVSTGFIYDFNIAKLRGSARVSEIRQELKDRGADFVICFFDEHSVDRWDIAASHEEAADDYAYLLKWLLDDPTLGLIFKPKVSATLFKRIAGVSDLIDRALATGRCRFLTSDTRVGDIFPAEAGLIADVCIGKLVGSTTVLETRLAGVPSVMIDTEGYRHHPFYAWGEGRTVFKDWNSFRVGIDCFRRSPASCPEFGDWSPALDSLDPFRDGDAALRLGDFIGWAFEALKQGASKQSAISGAATKYTAKWGKASVLFPSGGNSELKSLTKQADFL